MQKQVFDCLGRRIELWAHSEPDHMAAVIRASRSFYEPDVLMKCREIHWPGTAIVDAGANIGNHAVFFGAVLGATVYAFEPYLPNHDLLEMNIAANRLEGRVHPMCCALGDADGTASLHPGPDSNLGITRVSFGDGQVPVRSLDSLTFLLPIGLLKIDVEGAETAVLRGAAGLIRTWLPDIMVEAADASAFAAVADCLVGFGYAARGRYAVTPTYLFQAMDQTRRLHALLNGGGARF